MSAIPFTTQMGPRDPNTQGSPQSYLKLVVLVYADKRTERQSALMKECQEHLTPGIEVLVKGESDLESLPRRMKFFVIPSLSANLIKKIRDHFEQPIIYLPRAVIEARGHFRVKLPPRKLLVGLTMYSCKIFLVKNCDLQCLKQKISEMSGTVVASFTNDTFNVVITDTADNKYCSKAFRRNIPVVSKNWVDENYMLATEEDSSYFNVEAMNSIAEHQIKPFYGLHFKISIGTSIAQIKKMITDNQGHIIYGNENCLTHIVVPRGYDQSDGDEQSDSANKLSSERSQRPRIVDEEFLRACVETGHYLTRREFSDYKSASNNVVKKEQRSQQQQQQEQISQQVSQKQISPAHVEENHMPPSKANRYSRGTSENQTMLPPPRVPRPPVRQQPPDAVKDIVLEAFSASTFQAAQTQLASTQMRQLPDNELHMEGPYVPSQQLYWKDRGSKEE